MTNSTLINCKITYQQESIKNTLTAIFYEHSRNQFIRLSGKISAELTQDLYHNSTRISQLDFSNFKEDIEPTEEEMVQIYKELLSKKNSGSSLRYKISKLEDFEITAFELLSEKLVYYFRNEKLNLIGI
jgi:hypothetical protein